MSKSMRILSPLKSVDRDWKYFLLVVCVLLTSVVVLEYIKSRQSLTAILTAPTVTEIHSPKDAIIANIDATSGYRVDESDVLMTIALTPLPKEYTLRAPISGIFTLQKAVGEKVKKGEVVGYVMPNIDSNQLYFKILNGDVNQLSIGDKLEIVSEEKVYPGKLAIIIGDTKKAPHLKLLVLTTASLSLSNYAAEKKYEIRKIK
ncbi:hypothetical protein D210916BOD24_34630 [Alteromonas sp. D210916BOD_24]|uniref:hypothetical protein n=1 Tax=Alteromonas sp. D210916BOD_24 TaxID=3157618 RepID=UPI00399D219D